MEWKISTFGIHQDLLGGDGDDVLVPPSLFLLSWTWCSDRLSQSTVEVTGTEVAQAPERVWDSILYIIICYKAYLMPVLNLLGYFYAILQYTLAFLSVVWWRQM